MNCLEIQAAYQECLRERFPAVSVEVQPSPEYSAYPHIDVFFVPDDQTGAFMDYVLDELPVKLAERKIEFWGVIPHSFTATLKHYPEMGGASKPAQTTMAVRVEPRARHEGQAKRARRPDRRTAKPAPRH